MKRLSLLRLPAWPLTSAAPCGVPSLVSEFFGLDNWRKNYGVIYLGFGISSILRLVNCLAVRGFYITFCVIFALLIISLALSTTIRQPQRRSV